MYTFSKGFLIAAVLLSTAMGYAQQKKENPCNPCGKKKDNDEGESL